MKTRITPEYLEERLRENNLPFECFNRGMHYRINNKCDFWPSTSRYSFLHGKCSGHGLEEMINLLLTGQTVVEEPQNRNVVSAKNFNEKPYKLNEKKSFSEIVHTDFDELEKEDLKRIIVYLSKKLMEAEQAIAKLAPF